MKQEWYSMVTCAASWLESDVKYQTRCHDDYHKSPTSKTGIQLHLRCF